MHRGPFVEVLGADDQDDRHQEKDENEDEALANPPPIHALESSFRPLRVSMATAAATQSLAALLPDPRHEVEMRVVELLHHGLEGVGGVRPIGLSHHPPSGFE